MGKEIVMVIAPLSFRDEEYFEPKEYFEGQGYNVTTASRGVEKAEGKMGGVASVDIDVNNINEKDYDTIVFSGGPGAKIYTRDENINSIIKSFYENNKPVAAICIAPTILAYAGILNGKNATVFNEDGMGAKVLEREGANFTANEVEEDGLIITGNGPLAAKEFAQKVVEKLENN